MKVGNTTLKLDPSLIQISPSGKEYQVIGLEKNLTVAPKGWGNNLKYHWKVFIRFIENKKLVVFNFDYYDNCIKKEQL